jgi:apolipoprotein N-acyltransferase
MLRRVVLFNAAWGFALGCAIGAGIAFFGNGNYWLVPAAGVFLAIFLPLRTYCLVMLDREMAEKEQADG